MLRITNQRLNQLNHCENCGTFALRSDSRATHKWRPFAGTTVKTTTQKINVVLRLRMAQNLISVLSTFGPINVRSPLHHIPVTFLGQK